MSRVPYVQPEELPADKQHVIESQTVRTGDHLHILQAIGNNLPLLEARREYGAALREDSGLSERQRELVILTVAAELRSRYIWHQHVRLTNGDVCSPEELRAIAAGESDVFDAEDAALVEYVRRFTAMDVDDDAHESVSAFFDAELVVGIGMIAMGYVGLARGGDAFGVEIEEDQFVGWELENV